MGIFDRFRSTSIAADSISKKAAASEQDATSLIEAGHALEAQGRLDEAMQHYLEATRLAHNPARAHLNRGNILLLKGDLQGALEAFATAIRHKPDYAGAYYNIGNALLDNRQFDQAVDNYRRALEIQPDYAEAHCSLGIALKELGQLDEAIACFQQALASDPNLVEARDNLNILLVDLYNTGNLLLNEGKPEDAAVNFRLALRIQPDSADAHFSLGMALQHLGQPENAMASYRSVLELKPHHAEAHYNLGIILQGLEQFHAAEASFWRALEIQPDSAEAHNNLGVILQHLDQPDIAIASFQRTIELKPDFDGAYCNMGLSQQKLGQFENAKKSFQQALEINPSSAEAHNNLGLVFHSLEQFESAVTCFKQALQLQPGFPEAHNNLGVALFYLGKLEETAASFRRALELDPDYAEAHNNLGCVLKDLGQIESAITSFRRAIELKPDYADALSNMLFLLNYRIPPAPASYLEEARQYGRAVARMAKTRFSAWQCDLRPERLRVGMVSGDLRNHSAGHFLENFLAHLDSDRIELIAYPTYHIEDDLTARIRPHFSAWRTLSGKNDEASARLIHADGVHILFDLAGHSAHNRLSVFAWKPAPVQVSWLGYFASTGMAEMDYFLGDQWTLPEEEAHHFVERGWPLPEAGSCLTPPRVNAQVAALPALQNRAITFGSLNNLTKMNDQVVACWAAILNAVPASRLYLNTSALANEGVKNSVIERYVAHGIDPGRLILEATTGRGVALNSYNKIDIALDPFPYPGGTSSYEALWMGVPILTMRGCTFISHLGESIARNAGLPGWIATGHDDYVAKAVSFSSDLEQLAALRAGLRQQVLDSPLFDAPRFAKHFEEALWAMWQQYQDKQDQPA